MPVTPNGVSVSLERDGVFLYYLVTVNYEWPGDSRKFERRVPHRDSLALTEAIREGVFGRVMGGEWQETKKE